MLRLLSANNLHSKRSRFMYQEGILFLKKENNKIKKNARSTFVMYGFALKE